MGDDELNTYMSKNICAFSAPISFLLLFLMTGCSSTQPILLGEWTVGDIGDMAWSPDSKMFAVSYRDVDEIIQAFSVKTLESMWIAENTLALDLAFTPDGQFIIQSNTHAPFFYWRNLEQGRIAHMGEFTDISQIKSGDCNGGGQIIAVNSRDNTALVVDYNDLLGPSWRTNHFVSIRKLDLQTGKCINFFDYQGSFDLFDLNSSNTLLAFGGEGENDEVIIWDVEKQTEICRIPTVDFGKFVPNENTLAVIRKQRTVFVNAQTCEEERVLNLSPSSDYTNYFTFSPDGKEFAIASDSLQIIKTSTSKIVADIPFPEKSVPISIKFFLNGIEFSPDGHYILVAYFLLNNPDHDGKIQLWQLK